MNTTSAAVLAVALVAGAAIISYSLGAKSVEPSAPLTVPVDGAAERADAPAAGGASLSSGSSKSDVERLAAELRAARLQIKELQERVGAEDASGAAAGTESPAEWAKAQQRFFELSALVDAGTATAEQKAEHARLSKDDAFMGRVASSLQKQIAENPDDLEARLQLVDVQSSRVHTAESINDRSTLGRSVREQIGAILERDPENWQARFMKAVGISHSQRTPQGRAAAIREFKSLLELQRGRSSEARFAQTYGQLAEVYLAERNTSEAQAALREGLARYPDDKDLAAMLERVRSADK